jgi:hypothetical protein
MHDVGAVAKVSRTQKGKLLTYILLENSAGSDIFATVDETEIPRAAIDPPL